MKCEFCGAAVKPGWNGQNEYWFECGTMYPSEKSNRYDQTALCAKSEREKMVARIQHLESEKYKWLRFAARLNAVGDGIIASGYVPESYTRLWEKAKEVKP